MTADCSQQLSGPRSRQVRWSQWHPNHLFGCELSRQPDWGGIKSLELKTIVEYLWHPPNIRIGMNWQIIKDFQKFTLDTYHRLNGLKLRVRVSVRRGVDFARRYITTLLSRLQIATTDTYDRIRVLSFYWAADDLGSESDAELFLETMSFMLRKGIIQENLKLQGGAVVDLVATMRPRSLD